VPAGSELNEGLGRCVNDCEKACDSCSRACVRVRRMILAEIKNETRTPRQKP